MYTYMHTLAQLKGKVKCYSKAHSQPGAKTTQVEAHMAAYSTKDECRLEFCTVVTSS